MRCWQLAARDISIHALLAESDMFEIEEEGAFLISIHALLAESDDGRCFSRYNPTIFLSTLSLRRATPLAVTLWETGKTFLSTLSLRRATYGFY